jgi:hypothetical protein
MATLTPTGRGVVDALDEPVRRMHRRQLGHLGEAELRALSELLEAARDAAPAPLEPGSGPSADAASRPPTPQDVAGPR